MSRSNIKDYLWDKDCTGIDEYLIKRGFYDYMSPGDEFFDDYYANSTSFDLDYSRYTFYAEEEECWEESNLYQMDEELWLYSLYGIEALKIYDNKG